MVASRGGRALERVRPATVPAAYGSGTAKRRRAGWLMVASCSSARITRRAPQKRCGVGTLSLCACRFCCCGSGRLFHLHNDRAALIIALNASSGRSGVARRAARVGGARGGACRRRRVRHRRRAMLVFVPWGIVARGRRLRGLRADAAGYGKRRGLRGGPRERLLAPPVVAVEAAAWRSFAGRRLCVRGRRRGAAAALEDSGDAVEARWQ